MKTKHYSSKRRLAMWGSLIAAAIMLLGNYHKAQAQWTTAQNGNDVYKTNTAGNVGIGTQAPAYPLHVEGASADPLYSQGYFKNTSTANPYGGIAVDGVNQSHVRFLLNGALKWQWRVGGGTSVDDLRAYSWTLGADVAAFKNNGNIGFGTTSPNPLGVSPSTYGRVVTVANPTAGARALLELWTNNAPSSGQTIGQISFLSGASPTQIGAAILSNANGTTTNTGNLRFYTASTNSDSAERMVIDYTGNVGIGTASPQKPLHVISPTSFNGIAVGKNDNLNLLVIGYDNTNNIGAIGSFAGGSASSLTLNAAGGNVGIGTPSPASGYKLDVNGSTNVTGNLNTTGTITGGNIIAKYQDMAEWVPSSEQIAAGTVVVLDSTKSNQVISSSQSYDTRVAGVVSEQPGIALGEGGKGKVLVATTGRVLVKVNTTKAPIHIGDLLATSDVPGVAMKSEPVTLSGIQLHRPGTIIGKALEPLEKGSAKILVLLSLQ